MSASGLLDAALQAGLGLLLLHSGASKQRHYVLWWQALGHYRVLPSAFKPMLARAMPWMEMALGAVLFLPLADSAAAVAAGSLFCLFALVVGANWAAGVKRFDCGCQFGARRAHAAAVLARALGFALLSTLSMALPHGTALDSLLMAVAAALAYLCWASWRQLAMHPPLDRA